MAVVAVAGAGADCAVPAIRVNKVLALRARAHTSLCIDRHAKAIAACNAEFALVHLVAIRWNGLEKRARTIQGYRLQPCPVEVIAGVLKALESYDLAPFSPN